MYIRTELRLVFEDVETSTADPTLLQGTNQGLLVDNRTLNTELAIGNECNTAQLS